MNSAEEKSSRWSRPQTKNIDSGKSSLQRSIRKGREPARRRRRSKSLHAGHSAAAATRIIPFPGLWPDGRLRMPDSPHHRVAGHELLRIVEVLVTLNRIGGYTAFFQCFAHVGELEIRIYEGRWNWNKRPVYARGIDYRDFPLIETETGRPFYARTFREQMILLVQ